MQNSDTEPVGAQTGGDDVAGDASAGDTVSGSDDVDVALAVHFDDDDGAPAEVRDGGGEVARDDAEPPPASEVRRFLDRRRPWLRPHNRRDRQRRFAALYWSGVYVLLMAGATSMVSFLVVRGYLWIAPGPTTTGAGVARRVVPWVLTIVFLGFAYFVTRSLRRLVVLGLLFLAPTLAFAFVGQAQSLAEWVVSWIPGTTTVYGLTAFGPVVAVILLGTDFVKWQLWVEFPQASCWGCGARVRDERWIVCPYCDNDLEAQRDAGDESDDVAPDEAVAEAAATGDTAA